MAEIPKAYEPQAVEEKWYQYWLEKRCFVADPKSPKPPFSIVIPPPNVTGVLTLGHVLNNTIQDILSRKARMEGKEVLWLPGTDHAGIATQTVVERTLKKQGVIKHRDDLGREKFLEKVWEWKEKHGGIIIQQLKKLGASCDWTRERFTMDPAYSRCVQKVFVDLYRKGLIYRGKRMVNWCPVSLTALSDEEVTMKEQNGSLYYFKVEVVEAPGTFLTIATTRPETIPGDTAIAVNPKDPRYAHLIGKHVLRPLPAELSAAEKRIPIIGDDHVDFQFGTGVLKVTPAHDRADFEIGLRHLLPAIEVINADGSMNQRAGQDLAGMDRFKARKVAAEKLKELGLLEKEEPYKNNVGFSERADVPIEPRLSEQWFLRYPSTEQARSCVANGEMKFFPERWAKVYDHWLQNIQDWCISRQLWWGHRVPIWTKSISKDNLNSVANESLRQVHEHILEREKAAAGSRASSAAFVSISLSGLTGEETYFTLRSDESGDIIHFSAATDSPAEGRLLDEAGFTQDPDVLDTWFSSWLWPFATMGWPEQTETLKRFYPTSVLVTGPDIIFFWVARMIMAGYEYMGEMPFRDVYFTGIIRDKLGRKMSKSLGNSPDPLDLIAKYGADALRFGIMRSAPQGQDVLYDEVQVELGRNFCNKLYNACRFRQMQGGEVEAEINPSLFTSDDKWILLRLDAAIREITDALGGYRFSEAANILYRFFWSEFCDWYLESTKAVLFGNDATQKASTVAVLDFVLSNTLRLFHPFLPFITEELWHGLGYDAEMPAGQGGESIMYAPWPKELGEDFKTFYGLDESDERFVNAKYEMITQGRNLRREGNIQASKRVKFIFKPAHDWAPYEAEVLKLLLNAESLEVNPNYQPKKGTPTALSPLGELYLPLEGLIDVEAEKARLAKELEKISAEIEKVQAKLNNPSFVQKVPPAVLEEHQKRLSDWLAKRQQVESALANLNG